MSGSKFKIGDIVYRAHAVYTGQWEPCADCNKTGQVQVVTAKDTYTAPCPYCGPEQYGFAAMVGHVKVYDHRAYVECLTIGQVTVQERQSERTVEYMCHETGIGSGSIHREALLFSTRDEALIDAARQADANKAEKARQDAERVNGAKKARVRKKKV